MICMHSNSKQIQTYLPILLNKTVGKTTSEIECHLRNSSHECFSLEKKIEEKKCQIFIVHAILVCNMKYEHKIINIHPLTNFEHMLKSLDQLIFGSLVSKLFAKLPHFSFIIKRIDSYFVCVCVFYYVGAFIVI